jgi:hypothetical protein
VKSRRVDMPECGYWMIRLVKGGPEVPARIYAHATQYEPGNPDNVMERPSFLVAEISGEPAEVDSVWLRKGREITEREYNVALIDQRFARTFAPATPVANPTKRIDLLKTALPF